MTARPLPMACTEFPRVIKPRVLIPPPPERCGISDGCGIPAVPLHPLPALIPSCTTLTHITLFIQPHPPSLHPRKAQITCSLSSLTSSSSSPCYFTSVNQEILHTAAHKIRALTPNYCFIDRRGILDSDWSKGLVAACCVIVSIVTDRLQGLWIN